MLWLLFRLWIESQVAVLLVILLRIWNTRNREE